MKWNKIIKDIKEDWDIPARFSFDEECSVQTGSLCFDCPTKGTDECIAINEDSGKVIWKRVHSNKENVPEDDETILVCNEATRCGHMLAYYEKESNSFFPLFSIDAYPIVVTHWTSLPPLP